MNRQELISLVREELAVAAPDVPPDVMEDASLRSDLQVDSLALLELVARLEYRFNTSVPDEDWPRLGSIGEIADYLLDSLVGS
jgi:acyl carrier protein